MKNSARKLRLTVVLIAVAIIAVGVMTACYSKVGDTNLEYKIEDNGEITIVSYTDSTLVHDITVPDEIDGKPVTKIADFGIVNAENLYTIRIGKNVKEIGTWAFTNNQGMGDARRGGLGFVVDEANPYFTSVDGVLYTKDMKKLLAYPTRKGAEIDDKLNVVSYCENYTVPEGVEVISEKAFYKCGYLRGVTLPSTLKRIEEKAFHKCTELGNVTLPEGLEYIGKDAFAYCTRTAEDGISGFTRIEIPASVNEIGEYAFYNCRAVTEIVVHKAESDVKALQNSGAYGKKWYPTDNGRAMKDINYIYG